MNQAQSSCKSSSSHSNDINLQNMDNQTEEKDDTTANEPECAVCLQLCILPVRLPCNHVFCYLCVKGVANQSKQCPMCRQEIPADFIECPQLVESKQIQQKETTLTVDDSPHEEYQWFYEGRNGWWQYDQRTSLELETAYKQGKQTCELLIAGFLYIADFSSMLQLRHNDHSRKRRIKRDYCSAPKKGVAGLRLNNSSVRKQVEQQVREIRGAERPASRGSDNIGDGINIPISSRNTSQTLAGGPTSRDSPPLTTSRQLDHQRSDSLHQIIHYPGYIRRHRMQHHQLRNISKYIVAKLLNGLHFGPEK